MSANPGSVPIFLLFADQRGARITLDFVLAEDAERSDGSLISAGQPFAASFTEFSGDPGHTMQTLERWAARSRTVEALSGVDAHSRHLLILSQDEQQVVLEYC
jgi:hypothetical protein